MRRASRAWLLQPLHIPTEAMAPTLVTELTVASGHVYVLGDNARKAGIDSRSLGPIPLERCIGRARGVFMSGTLKRIGTSL